MDDKHMQIGEVATRTELSLRTIRHYEEAGLVIPSARSQGGFRLYTETDVARLMVIRRMKPLGFTLDQMRDLLDATDRLDGDDALDSGEREALLERVRTYQQAAAEQVEKLRVQLSRAEDFATTLSARLERDTPSARVHASVGQEDEPRQVAETEGARAEFAAGERFA
ncbi:MerR family transcriptional regulator [Streptomyces mutabilis]|uniref:MerR family transcriptional regulator n=1 Tax=Streptomyces mutabilis TaxID=67332 RepID=UPI003418CD84